MKTKAEIRGHIKSMFRTYSSEMLRNESEAVLRQLEAMEEFISARTVALYWSLPDEVYTHSFIRKLCGHKTILLPVMRPEFRFDLVQYTAGCPMSPAEFSILEPEGAEVKPKDVDLFVVPGVAFDRENRRLGRGKGYYDRLLAGVPGFKVGVCFGFQYLEMVPYDPYDIPMDRVIHS